MLLEFIDLCVFSPIFLFKMYLQILASFWHIMRQIFISLTALSPVSVPSLTAPSQSKQIAQCAHEDDFVGKFLLVSHMAF